MLSLNKRRVRRTFHGNSFSADTAAPVDRWPVQDIGSLIQAIDQKFPGIAEKVLDGDGNVKRFINVFVNDSEIRTLQGLQTPVSDSDRVSIVPAMAGGQG